MSDSTTYEAILKVANKLRTAHWESVKYRSRQAAEREHKAGLELDKLLRVENHKRDGNLLKSKSSDEE